MNMQSPYPMGLEALAVRCEAASEPSVELDGLSAAATGAMSAAHFVAWEEYQINGHSWKPSDPVPVPPSRYTASLDAAMTLVPDGNGRWPQVEYIGPNPNNKAVGHRWRIWLEGRPRMTGHSLASAALALTAAALRARASVQS